jgi:hypothetical protein
LFYELSLESHVPPDHLLRAIDGFVDCPLSDVFGVAVFIGVFSKIVMKHHLNVHHSNSTPYVVMNNGNHRGRPSPLKAAKYP